MATIKSYTDIEQSRRLAKIFAVETSDYYYPITYIEESTNKYLMSYVKPYIGRLSDIKDSVDTRLYIPCWSLTALLDVLPTIDDEFEPQLHRSLDKYRCTYEGEEDSSGLWRVADNPVDACYEMILTLHKLNLL